VTGPLTKTEATAAGATKLVLEVRKFQLPEEK